VAEYTFRVFLAGLVKAIHVELSDETVDFVVPEKPGQHHLLELNGILDDELWTWWGPINDPWKLIILK
jgi:hypothetical protein